MAEMEPGPPGCLRCGRLWLARLPARVLAIRHRDRDALAFNRYNLFVLAAGAGVAAFFSPCVFPLLPGYVTYDLGLQASRGNRLVRSLALGVAAALGVIAVNVAIGAVMPCWAGPRRFNPIRGRMSPSSS